MPRLAPVPFVFALVLNLAPASSSAQLTAAKDSPVVYGHHHLNVTNIAESRKFWVALAGAPAKLGTIEVVKFSNVLVLMTQRPPTGGSKGSTADHIGLQVPNLRATVERLQAAGFAIVTGAEIPADLERQEQNGIAYVLSTKQYVAFAMGPDGVKVELVENKALMAPAALHHIHFVTSQVDEMRAWYAKIFGAKLPGVNLAFRMAQTPVTGTRGRAVDHIGFEVKNLEAFVKNLEAMGVKMDRPYSKLPGMDLTLAFLTDPWGTYIELTEGLDKVE